MSIAATARAHPSLTTVSVEIIKLPHGQGLPLPTYSTTQSAGFDLYAAIEDDIILHPGHIAKVPTGIALALPEGFEAQIRSRSGLAAKNGVVILNSPGTIDADYRGEIIGILINHGTDPFTITRGLRFAQMVVASYVPVQWEECAAFSQETVRGENGFGSTGLHRPS